MLRYWRFSFRCPFPMAWMTDQGIDESSCLPVARQCSRNRSLMSQCCVYNIIQTTNKSFENLLFIEVSQVAVTHHIISVYIMVSLEHMSWRLSSVARQIRSSESFLCYVIMLTFMAYWQHLRQRLLSLGSYVLTNFTNVNTVLYCLAFAVFPRCSINGNAWHVTMSVGRARSMLVVTCSRKDNYASTFAR